MRVIILAMVPFPYGGAATSRVRSIALGLKEAGVDVFVIALSDPNQTNLSHPASSPSNQWRGIPLYLCTGEDQFRPSVERGLFSKIVRRITKGRITGTQMVLALEHLDMLGASSKFDAVILYNQEWKLAYSVSRICKRYSIRLVQQMAERHIPSDYRMRFFEPIYIREYLHSHIVHRISDGAIVISSALKERLHSSLRKKTLIVPALTNTEIVEDPPPLLAERKESVPVIVTYLGGGGRRENIGQIVGAAEILSKNCIPIGFLLMGLSESNRSHWDEVIRSKNLSGIVGVKGKVSEEELRSAVSSTNIFVLPRSFDLSTRSSFPTRLPEFMIKAVPVIITDVGDIGFYLEDMKNAVFLNTGNPSELASKIALLADHKELAKGIGLSGRDACIKYFSFRHWGEEISRFLQQQVKSTNIIMPSI